MNGRFGRRPFTVVNDGPGYVPVMTKALDTLIHERRLPPNLVTLFVASGGDDAQGSQRGLEYDTASGRFAEFVDAEVLPFVASECGIQLTDDPDGRVRHTTLCRHFVSAHLLYQSQQ